MTYVVGETKIKHNQITFPGIIPQYNKHMGGADFC